MRCRAQFLAHLLLINPSLCLSHKMSTTKSSVSALRGLTELTFDNRNINNLPIDTSGKKTQRPVANAIFSTVDPTPVKNPRMMAYSASVFTDMLGVRPPSSPEEAETFAKFFAGNSVLPGSRPAAHCYCGHQFGNFAGQLGDGATMYLGEVINPNTGKRWELQLKGAGKTPFSRTADGRKVLRSSVREFLCSEAMHFLGVPTTRAGTCVTSDSTVQRDPMYDGGVIDERCTVVSRIASNFFRFGSFEIFKPAADDGDYDGRAGPSAGNSALKKQLLDHILLYYPDIAGASIPESEKYEKFFAELVRRTAFLVAKWQAVGFVHGVLNTDNMSVMGLTIDYGPYGFMEHYDPQYVPNGSDSSARYSYQEQPQICKWNLGKLAEMLDPLLHAGSAARFLDGYDDIYQGYYQTLLGGKMGLTTRIVATAGDSEDEPVPRGLGGRLEAADLALVESFFAALTATNGDFTDSFVALTGFVADLDAHLRGEGQRSGDDATLRALTATLVERLTSRSASPASLVQSLRRKLRIHRLNMHPGQVEQIYALLQSAPPAQLSRMFNGAPVDAIREEIMGEKRKLDLLVSASTGVKTYEAMDPAAKRDKDRDTWEGWCVQYASRMAELLRADASNGQGAGSVREEVMRAQNPTFVLRSWLAQDAIEQAEKSGDFAGVNTLLQMLQEPFNPQFSTFLSEPAQTCSIAVAPKEEAGKGDGKEGRASELRRKYASMPPDWADSIICTCSS